jgi:hypothetical protein
MKRSRVLLAVSAALFLAWIGWLAYLAATATEPIVLSRPQFLHAELYVVAEVTANPAADNEPDGTVTVKRLLWSSNALDGKLQKMQVRNLPRLNAQHGWNGPGEYILALSRTGDSDVFLVTPLPRTPGFSGSTTGRMYPATRQTLKELDQLNAEFHP